MTHGNPKDNVTITAPNQASPIFGPAEHVHVFNNASQSPIFHAYRKMRTERLLDFGWRTPADLVNEIDHDRFDESGAKTIHVVITDQREQPIGCSRITIISPEEIRNSISPAMWGEALSDVDIPEEVIEVARMGRLGDMNRLLNQPGMGFEEAAVVIGAAVAATRSRYGCIFTAGAALIRLVGWLDVPRVVIHDGRLGGRRAQLIYIPSAAWSAVGERAQASFGRGAELFRESAGEILESSLDAAGLTL